MTRYPNILANLELFLNMSVTVHWRSDSVGQIFPGRTPTSWSAALSSELPLDESIQRIWNIVSEPAETFIKTLSNRTQDLGLAISRSELEILGLVYVFQHPGTHEYSSWLGQLPSRSEDAIVFQQKFGVMLPDSFARFCSVHNGFCRDGWSSLGFRPIQKIYALEHWIQRSGVCQSYESIALLAFSGDGMGNERCYDLRYPSKGNDFLTTDWDHETRDLTDVIPFWDYLNSFARREMG